MTYFLVRLLQVKNSIVDEDVVETPTFKEEPQPTIPTTSTEDDDDTMSYFQKLAKE